MGAVSASTIIIGAAIGATATVGGSAIAAHQQKQAAKGAANRAKLIGDEINALEEERRNDIPVINPYESAEDLSSMITDLSGNLSNAFDNMGVATGAAEIQMEQTDLALANTLDALMASGASAGGATALAQAAASSKKSIAAGIEAQEARNQQFRAQGESNLQKMKMAEAQRVQSGLFGEATRQQDIEAKGKEFVYREKDNRMMQQLNRKTAQQTGQQQIAAQRSADAANIMGAGIAAGANIFASGLTSAASMGTSGTRSKVDPKVTMEMPNIPTGDNAFV
tara:strand:- start:1313 stop:2155 length:843 start_codon:yes stop_codon:yes gene_type:complete